MKEKATFIYKGRFYSVDSFRQALVIIDPFLHISDSESSRGAAHDHFLDAGVDDDALAHGAGDCICESPIAGFPAHQIQGTADHIPAGGGNDGVGLGMDTAAQLVPLTGGHLEGFPAAEPQVSAVFSASGGTVVPRGDDLIVAHDDGAVPPADAGRAVEDGISDIQIVIDFVSTMVHGLTSFFY